MISTEDAGGVRFPHSGDAAPAATRSLQVLLQAIRQVFPNDLSGLKIPSRESTVSRHDAAEWLLQLEVSRTRSPRRDDIARAITQLVQRTFVIGSRRDATPLDEAFAQPAEPLPIEVVPFDALRPVAGPASPRGAGEAHRPPHELFDRRRSLEELERLTQISSEAARAIERTTSAIERADSRRWDLNGHRFVLLGGTAELAPLSLLLAAGADVLTTHTSAMSIARAAVADLPPGEPWRGRLFAVPGGVDLLVSPVSFAETARAFANGGRVHLGAFAYRGGEGREWRLAASTNGIVDSLLRTGTVASLSMYLSPSVTTVLSDATAQLAIERGARAGVWTSAVRTLTRRGLFEQNVVSSGGRFLSRSFVSHQGASYMAGNLFGKNYVAEVLAGGHRANDLRSVRISANVGPIVRTRSTDTPEAALTFPQLHHVGIRVFDSVEARYFMYLLMLDDLFGPDPVPRAVPFERQLHGGVFTCPWSLESVFRQAYVRGLVSRGIGH